MLTPPPRRTRILAICAAQGLLVVGILWGIRHETEAVNVTVNEISELRDPSPFRAALLGHLGKIQLGIEACLRGTNPLLEKQLDESRQEFEALLPEFMRQNPKLLPKAAGEEIKQTFSLYKDAVAHTLEVNAERMTRRRALEDNFSRILFIIGHNLRPLIRKDQADGEERLGAVLNIENQTRAWLQDLAQAWAQPSDNTKALTYENDNRGETYLELYARLELLPRERRFLNGLRSLWQANSQLARDAFAKETIVAQSQKAMEGNHGQVVATLNAFLPALPPAEMEIRKQSILNTMRIHLAAACMLGLLGLVSFIVATLALYRLRRARAPMGGSAAEIQMNLNGQMTEWSPEAAALYGYTSGEMIGQSISKLFDSESEIARLGQELQKATRAAFDTTHKTKAGNPLAVRIEFRPVADNSGHAAAIRLSCVRR